MENLLLQKLQNYGLKIKLPSDYASKIEINTCICQWYHNSLMNRNVFMSFEVL